MVKVISRSRTKRYTVRRQTVKKREELDRHSRTERGKQKEEEMRDSAVPGGGRGGGGSE